MNLNNGSRSNQANSAKNLNLATTSQDTSFQAPSNGKGRFDQGVILKQSRGWSRAILWTIVGVTTFGVVWAYFARIEEAVPAQGKLEPQGAVQEVQVPVSGVVTEVNIEDGERVKQGQVLLKLEPAATEAEFISLTKIRSKLVQENQFYRAAIDNPNSPPLPPTDVNKKELIQLASQLPAIIKRKEALEAENLLYRAQLDGDFTGTNFNAQQRERLRVAQAELDSRVAAAESEVEQLKKRQQQNQVQLENSQNRLDTEQKILDQIQPIWEQGAVPEIQYRRQESEVGTRRSELEQLQQEEVRLDLDIAQAEKQLENTKAVSQKDLTDLIAGNDKEMDAINVQFNDIVSQLNKTIVENDKRIAEIDSQLKQAELTLGYQKIKAPVEGIVFELQASKGYVANSNSIEPILKIVPGDDLIAKVYITNQDIGFVEEDMDVDVRIDSFPFSEFGDIKGKLMWIGSDALPPAPDENRPFYSFPAKVKLNQQTLKVNETRDVKLQSGMSVSVNIKIRDRRVINIFTDLFSEQVDNLKQVR
ncbi:MAG: HlyD family efflux transporter periplasmic adaptor subunit [Symploca sp. SIO2E6]|nr:HlyD family efflux transporter periplasmic adaptor subunit [Symploca sp. SIO2E6]